MKTAMQELIEWLDIAIEELKGNDSTDFAEGLVAARVKANKALEKEKEQMFYWFYGGGGLSATDDFREEFENNYNQTYKQEIEKQII
jgi:hypothetical protein